MLCQLLLQEVRSVELTDTVAVLVLDRKGVLNLLVEEGTPLHELLLSRNRATVGLLAEALFVGALTVLPLVADDLVADLLADHGFGEVLDDELLRHPTFVGDARRLEKGLHERLHRLLSDV